MILSFNEYLTEQRVGICMEDVSLISENEDNFCLCIKGCVVFVEKEKTTFNLLYDMWIQAKDTSKGPKKMSWTYEKCVELMARLDLCNKLEKENAELRAQVEELDTAARKFRELLLKAEAKIAELEKQTIWDHYDKELLLKAPTGFMCYICNQDSSLCKNHLTILRYQAPQQPKEEAE